MIEVFKWQASAGFVGVPEVSMNMSCVGELGIDPVLPGPCVRSVVSMFAP